MRTDPPAPIPYQGSKRKLAPAIVECLPSDAPRLFEPFAGSAAVSLAAAVRRPDLQIHLADTNAPLMALWTEIIERPTELAERYRQLWEAQLADPRAYYDEVRDAFNRTGQPDHFLFLLVRCVKAAVRYNAKGEFNQSPDKRRLGTKPDRMARNLHAASALLRGRAQVETADFRSAVARATPQDVIYMDPPYQGVSTNRDRRYADIMEYDTFVSALEDFNERGLSYIVSYDGRTGSKTHGKPLPEWLHLAHFEIDAGRSSQSTLSGGSDRTYESLYLSAPLVQRLGGAPSHLLPPLQLQI